MQQDSQQNRSFFGKIESEYGALAMISDVSTAFMLIGAFQVLSFLWHQSVVGLIEPAMLISAAYGLKRWSSKPIAILLLVYATAGGIFYAYSFVNRDLSDVPQGTAIILSLVSWWAGIRGFEAVVKLPQLRARRQTEGTDS